MRVASEGFVEVLGFRLYYRVYGDDPAAPSVLGLHGGPGASLDYLVPLADLAHQGFRVVLFDQLGCGRSEVPPGYELFTLEHHVAETEGIRAALGLGPVHVIGSSYGGLLGMAFALAHPSSLLSLVTVGGLASVPLAQREMDRLRRKLPPKVRRTLDDCEAKGTTDSEAYREAAMVFYRRHVCRLDPWPEELSASLRWAAERPVYPYMNGPSEFTITGTIRDVDVSERLPRIRAPTLVLGGRYDEVTPRVAAQIRAGIPGARSVTFSKSAHLPFWEERARFFRVVGAFLRSVEDAKKGGRAGPGRTGPPRTSR